MTTELRRSVVLSVRSALDGAGRSPQWLAETSGIDYGALRDKLDLRADFTVADLADIAFALGVPVADLMPRLDPGVDADTEAEAGVATD